MIKFMEKWHYFHQKVVSLQTIMKMMQNKVLLLYTGGTIGMGKNPRTNALEPLDFSNFVANMPEMKQIGTEIDVYQFDKPIDSSDMRPDAWARLVRIIDSRYEQYDGFVILHGTDTMAYTASALSFMLENLTKPVVLTGSQLPIGQLRTDGKENLVTSIEIASAYKSDGTPIVPEVCIYFSGKLLRGNRSTKQNADGFNAFDSFNYPHLCDAGVNITFHPHHILKPDFNKPMTPHYKMDSRVMVLSLFPGIEENFVRHTLNADGLRAVVMRSFGSGNAPQQPWLIETLKKATERGIIIVNISQCVEGFVAMERYDTGFQLKDAGVVSGRDGTVEAAVTKLMHLLARYDDTQLIHQLMSQSIAGEITV